MKLLLTGMSSSFTQEVSKSLESKGCNVTLIGRLSRPAFTLENPEISLRKYLSKDVCLVHFAHSFESQSTEDINPISARKIIECCEEMGVKRAIYISSDSASAVSKSHYGQSKYRTERVFMESSLSTVLRIGVITNDSVPSPYRSLKSLVKFTNTLIFPSLDEKIFRTSSVDDVAEGILKIYSQDISGGPYTSSRENSFYSLREILFKEKISPIFRISLPIALIYRLALVGRKIRFIERKCDSMISLVTIPEECTSIF